MDGSRFTVSISDGKAINAHLGWGLLTMWSRRTPEADWAAEDEQTSRCEDRAPYPGAHGHIHLTAYRLGIDDPGATASTRVDMADIA